LPDAVATPAGIGVALRRATARLEQSRSPTARLDAELLLASVLGTDRAGLVLRSADALPAAAEEAFSALVARRVAGEPVAYLTGRQWFRRLELEVDARVLIPRPETELLVEAGLELPAGARVADVGTGSGAVALALADERPDLQIVGTDISPAALTVARANAARLGLGVELREADLLDVGPWDAVLANLPYVAEGSPELASEVARYEPAVALYGGPDGLDLVRRLFALVDDVPFVALEIGFDQADEVERLLRAAGFAAVERRADLAGHDRVLVGRR
jgi:release factor glutamine methyltransferase